jgi:hypothetical protein
MHAFFAIFFHCVFVLVCAHTHTHTHTHTHIQLDGGHPWTVTTVWKVLATAATAATTTEALTEAVV